MLCTCTLFLSIFYDMRANYVIFSCVQRIRKSCMVQGTRRQWRSSMLFCHRRTWPIPSNKCSLLFRNVLTSRICNPRYVSNGEKQSSFKSLPLPPSFPFPPFSPSLSLLRHLGVHPVDQADSRPCWRGNWFPWSSLLLADPGLHVLHLPTRESHQEIPHHAH